MRTSTYRSIQASCSLAVVASLALAARPASADTLEQAELFVGREATAITRVSLTADFTAAKLPGTTSAGGAGVGTVTGAKKEEVKDIMLIGGLAYAKEDGPTLEARIPFFMRSADVGDSNQTLGNLVAGARWGKELDLAVGGALSGGVELILPTSKGEFAAAVANRYWMPEAARRTLAVVPNASFGVDLEFVTAALYGEVIAGGWRPQDPTTGDAETEKLLAYRLGGSASVSLIDLFAIVLEVTQFQQVTGDDKDAFLSLIPGVRLNVAWLSVGVGARLTVVGPDSIGDNIGGMADVTLSFQ